MAPPAIRYNEVQEAFRRAINVEKRNMPELLKAAWTSEGNAAPNAKWNYQEWLEKVRERVVLANFPVNGTKDQKVAHVRGLFPNLTTANIEALQQVQGEQQQQIQALQQVQGEHQQQLEEHEARLDVQDDAIAELREAINELQVRDVERRDAGGVSEPLPRAPVQAGAVPEDPRLRDLIGSTSEGMIQWSEAPYINDNERTISIIAEGSLFTAVFRLKHPTEPQYALKIVPFDLKPTGQVWCVEGLVNELRVSDALERIDDNESLNLKDHFVIIQSSAIVCGAKLPDRLEKAWKEWVHQRPERSSPDTFFAEKKISPRYLLIFSIFVEGEPLDLAVAPVAPEAAPLTMDQRWSIWAQLLIALASAERLIEFEHRDLHCRNVMVVRDDRDEALEYMVGRQRFRVRSHGVLIKILDFGMARAKTSPNTCTYFNFKLTPGFFDNNFDGAPNVAEKQRIAVCRWMGDRNRLNARWDRPLKLVNLRWMYLISRCLLDPQAFEEGPREDWEWQIDNDPVLGVLKKLWTWESGHSLHEFINLKSVKELNKYEKV